ncbi:MAG: FAD-dependent oxidoreductase [Oscillospiraceae bacterium]
MELEEAVSVSGEVKVKTVTCASGAEFQCRSLIIAAGAKPRTPGLPGEAELVGNGVCFCAVCDGAFYKDKVVAINGGQQRPSGRFAPQREVQQSLPHPPAGQLPGEAKLGEALKQRKNVEFVMNSRITALVRRMS